MPKNAASKSLRRVAAHTTSGWVTDSGLMNSVSFSVFTCVSTVVLQYSSCSYGEDKIQFGTKTMNL